VSHISTILDEDRMSADPIKTTEPTRIYDSTGGLPERRAR